jgi:hypothetical protein
MRLPTGSGTGLKPILSLEFWSNDLSEGYFLSVAKTVFKAFWRNNNGQWEPIAIKSPIPEAVRIIKFDGTEVCRWSLIDLLESGEGTNVP